MTAMRVSTVKMQLPGLFNLSAQLKKDNMKFAFMIINVIIVCTVGIIPAATES